MPVTSVIGASVSAPLACARSRMIVPARSESTTPIPGVEKPPSTMSVLTYGTIRLISAGSTSSDSMPHERDDAMRRWSSFIRSPRAGDLDPAALGEDAHLLVLLDAVGGQRGHLARVVGQEDEVRGVAGRAARVGQRALLDLDDVAPAQPGEVVDEAVADDARADDDDARGTR